MTIEYLLSAYRRLEGASNRYPMSEAHEENMEVALADIQLLGSPEQVRLSSELMLEFASTREVCLDPLLNNLRRSLRAELLLPPTNGNRQFLRFNRKP
ncbi:hypothetical protein BH10ACT2_BH10ACT2_19670 [soil metagenome]